MAARSAVEELMLKKVVTKMKRFCMNELERLLKILHLDMEWKDLMDKMCECRMRPTVKNAVSVLHQYLANNGSMIERTYHLVLLVDAIFHNSGYWWTVTVDKVNRRLLDKETIRNNVQAMLDKLNIRAIAYAMRCDQLFWVLINAVPGGTDDGAIRRNTTGGPAKLSNPCLFAVAPGRVFRVFHRPQNVDGKLLKVVVKSIGANKSKPYALFGKSPRSMVNLLADKDNEQQQQQGGKDDGAPTKEGDDVHEYVGRLFGDKRRVLNQFTINAQSDPSLFDDADNQPFKVKVNLKADNVVDGIRDMMLSGVLQPPYPSWATKLPVTGKNCVNFSVHA